MRLLLYPVRRLALSSGLTILSACASMATVGCGVVPSALAPAGTLPASAANLSGQVHGGQQPVVGAVISFYAAGQTGSGLGATSLLVSPVLSDLHGNFSITGDYTCPSATSQVYLVSRGGNPGLSLPGGGPVNNAAEVMVAAVGDCGSLSSGSYISINEVTTAAAAWSLAQFVGSNAGIGASAANATGLRNAFASVSNLVDGRNGFALSPTLPAGALIEQKKLYTLANILAVCVNSDGSAACTPLFTAAKVGGVAPTNTFDAAVNIVRHAGQNVGTVFAAAPGNGPFQPALASAPNDWTMSLTFVGGGISFPSSVALDSLGNVWVANYSSTPGGVATKLTPTGHPFNASGYSDPSLYASDSVAVDSSNNAWISNEQSSYYVNGSSGSITKLSSAGQTLSSYGFIAGGINVPAAIAADADGSMWVADYGNSTVSHLAANGTSLLGPNGIHSAALPFPIGIAVDGSHNAWVAVQASATKVTPAGALSHFACCDTQQGIALDATGNVWIANFSADSLVELAPNGSVVQPQVTGGGIQRPEIVASDSAGNIFVTCSDGSSFSVFTPGSRGTPSQPLSPASGFGLDANLSAPLGEAIDASGNLWVASFGASWVTEFLGIGVPVRTPLLGLPAAP